MISNFFINWGLGLLNAVVGWLMPGFDLSGISTSAVGTFGDLLNGAVGIGGWIPWATGMVCLGISLTVWLACFIARIVRVALGHVPLVGGNG